MFPGLLPGRRLLVTLCSLFFAASALGDEKPCTLHDNGKYYDLNPLKTSKDYEIKTPAGQTLSINVCQSVKTELFGLKDGIDAGEVGGVVRRAHGHFSIGKVNTSLTIFDSKPRYVMSDGSRCQAGSQTENIRASSVVEFICESSVLGAGTPKLLATLPPGGEDAACAFIIEWKTPYACPTSEGGGFLGFLATLAVIFLALLMSYTVLGTLYNRFVLDLRGYDQIPQFSVESMKYHGREAFEWTRDMIGIVALNLCNRSGSGNGYSSLSSHNSRTPNPVSHQAQVSGMGGDENLERGGLGNGGTFHRPQTTQSGSFQRPQTNPVSHQSQLAQSLSFSSSNPLPSQPVPPSTPAAPLKRTFGDDTRNSTKDEREFMLGDDEDAEELSDVQASVPSFQERESLPATSLSGPSSSTIQANSGTSNPAATARGRDLGGGGVIQL